MVRHVPIVPRGRGTSPRATKLHVGLRLLSVLHGSACADCAEEAGDKPPRYERPMKILLALPREIKLSPGAKIHATQPGKRRSR